MEDGESDGSGAESTFPLGPVLETRTRSDRRLESLDETTLSRTEDVDPAGECDVSGLRRTPPRGRGTPSPRRRPQREGPQAEREVEEGHQTVGDTDVEPGVPVYVGLGCHPGGRTGVWETFPGGRDELSVDETVDDPPSGPWFGVRL